MSSKQTKILLPVGMGNVGSAAVVKAHKELGLEVKQVVRSSGVYDYQTGALIGSVSELKPKWKKAPPDIVFITVPSYEDGKQAREHLSFFVNLEVPVVTAEKGALANFYSKLKKNLPLVGYSATVSGGTRMIGYVADRMGPTVNQLHMVVNGTLNFILDGVANGRTLGQVVDEAIKLGYAEPGAHDPLDVINGEAVGDVPKKISILWNLSGISNKVLEWRSIKQPHLNSNDLRELVANAKERRFIVSMYRKSAVSPAKNSIIAPFSHDLDGWHITGGFQNVNHNPLFESLKMPGPANGVVIATGSNEKDGVYHLSGPGAGPDPTAASMLIDARHLLKL